MARRRRRPPPPCPLCGKPTVLEGRFCRACGWDADLVDTEDSYLDGVDLPVGHGNEDAATVPRSPGGSAFLWIAAVLALAGFLYALWP
jgi:hypothetical protein